MLPDPVCDPAEPRHLGRDQVGERVHRGDRGVPIGVGVDVRQVGSFESHQGVLEVVDPVVIEADVGGFLGMGCGAGEDGVAEVEHCAGRVRRDLHSDPERVLKSLVLGEGEVSVLADITDDGEHRGARDGGVHPGGDLGGQPAAARAAVGLEGLDVIEKLAELGLADARGEALVLEIGERLVVDAQRVERDGLGIVLGLGRARRNCW